MTDEEIKEQVYAIREIMASFEEHTLDISEVNTMVNRRTMLRELQKIKLFNLKNDLIDRKIEFDQRFFNDGYSEFQLMVSDIRKQYRLNEEILAMRKQLDEIYKEIG